MKKFALLFVAFLLTVVSWSQCIVTTPFETGIAENDGSTVIVATCSLAGEYNTILGLTIGNDYEFTNTLSGTDNYVTITDTANNVIAHGMSPLTVNSIANESVRFHVTVDAACTTDGSCHTITVQCVSATCVPPIPPPNDTCATAEAVSIGIETCGISVTGTNFDATDSGVNQAGCAIVTYAGGDIWYQFTVPNGETTINYTLNSSVFSTTQLELYQGNCNALSEVDCTIETEYSFSGLTSGSTYYLRIYDWGNNDIGEVSFCLGTPAQAPINDECGTAINLEVGTLVNGNTIAATNSNVAGGTCSTTGEDQDIWYTFTANATMVTEGAAFNTTADHVVIYSDCTAATEIACLATGENSPALTNGATYYVRVYNNGVAKVAGPIDITLMEGTLSTADFTTNSIFSYYPNPVNNILTLNAQQAITNVTVFNMLGKEVIKTAPNAVFKDVDMSNLQPGAYFVQVTVGTAVETVRIIKN